MAAVAPTLAPWTITVPIGGCCVDGMPRASPSLPRLVPPARKRLTVNEMASARPPGRRTKRAAARATRRPRPSSPAISGTTSALSTSRFDTALAMYGLYHPQSPCLNTFDMHPACTPCIQPAHHASSLHTMHSLDPPVKGAEAPTSQTRVLRRSLHSQHNLHHRGAKLPTSLSPATWAIPCRCPARHEVDR